MPARRRLRLVVPLVLVSALAAGASVAVPALRQPVALARLAAAEAPATLPVPVAEIRPRDLADTWGGPRPGGRRHEGIDIFAARGTPVVSATRGVVVSVGTDRLGGNVVRVLGPGPEWHYYAHLDAFSDVAAGDAVVSGDTLGTVGTTGNAAGTPPHLHYGIYRAGGPVNPYPRLAGP